MVYPRKFGYKGWWPAQLRRLRAESGRFLSATGVTRRDVTSALFTLTLLAGAGIEVFVAAKLLQTAALSFYLDCVFHCLAFAVKLLGLRGLFVLAPSL